MEILLMVVSRLPTRNLNDINDIQCLRPCMNLRENMKGTGRKDSS